MQENKAGGRADITLDWYSRVIEVIDMRSFTSIWYWIVVAVVWSTAAHWTLGVPFDMVTHARRSESLKPQADLEALISTNVNRILYIIDISGPWIVAFVFFLLSALMALGFWYGIEIAQSIFLLLTPLSLVFVLSVRSARRIREDGILGVQLRNHLSRQRFINQAIGLVAIFITAFWGMWHNLNASVL